jgi:hypothetical protein|tara:strand:+ start:45 stop:794 length:750 start_codon:yes stop_codon:yes gene_type:complete
MQMALIGFDEYHMGTSMANPEADGLTALAKLLSTNNHELEFINTRLDTLENLPWDVIIIPFPKNQFSEDEMSALQSHLKNGKSILLLAEWGDLFGHVDFLNELTTPCGIEIQKDRVTDHEKNVTQKVELAGVVLGEEVIPHFVRVQNFADHPITRGISELIYFSGCSLRVSEEAIALASTSASSFGDIDLDSTLDEGEVQGELPIAAVSEMNGRLVVVGDSNIAANGYIEQGDNLLFVQQAIEWLSFNN